MMFYRGIRFAKDFVCQYLTSVFKAAEKDALLLTDGTKKVKFSSWPTIVKAYPIDARRSLPMIVIGPASGNYIYRSIAKDHIVSSEDGDPTQYRTVGGDIEISLDLSIRATTPEERDNLADIVGVYLSHPDAKTYFERQGIYLPEGPSFSGERQLEEPNNEFNVHVVGMNLRLLGNWRDTTDLPDRLIDIISDIDPYLT